MARIQVYANDNNIDDNDIVIGSDGAEGPDLGKTKNFTLKSIKEYTKGSSSYKVFTALLTQDGPSVPFATEGSENIYKGVTYRIGKNLNNYDLTIYGAPNNEVETYFISNADATLTASDDLILYSDQGAPVVKILENTIGDVWFVYNEFGQYNIVSNGLFSLNKTTGNNAIFYDGGVDSLCGMHISDFSINSISIYCTRNLGGVPNYQDSLFNNVFIEIRVYN